jgi:hypothetical protein
VISFLISLGESKTQYSIKALNRKPETMYGQRRVNPLIQKAGTEQNEAMFTKQEIQRRLGKVKSMLKQLDESQETV